MQVRLFPNSARPGIGLRPRRESDRPLLPRHARHCPVLEAESSLGFLVFMLMIGLGGDRNKIEHDGHYEDTYVKTPQGWRFQSRIPHAFYNPGGGRRGGTAPPQGAAPAAPGSQPQADRSEKHDQRRQHA